MIYNFVLLVSLTCCIVGTDADFNLDDVPPPIPDFCSRLPSTGSGRASFPRYRFNAGTNQCENFTWKGGRYEQNIFFDQQMCERTCMRETAQQRAFNSTFVSCEFEANLARDCSFNDITDFQQITDCIVSSNHDISQGECRTKGCCWQYGSCFQKSSAFIESTCSIRYASSGGFWGKINFQADEDYPPGWVGVIKFNVPVTGGFCLLRDRVRPNIVDISDVVYANRTRFLLPGRRFVYAGENIAILFSGSYDQSQFSNRQCEFINTPNDRYSNRVNRD